MAILPKVLLADDDPAVLRVLGRRLDEDGFEVLSASNGRDALRLAQARSPGVIVLDAHMGDMTGFQLCRLLKEDNRTAAIPVIMVSGTFVERQHKRAARELGALDYLIKPVEWSLLRKRLEEALAGGSGPGRAAPAAVPETARGDVLVADDDPESLERTRAWLESGGFRVISAAEGSSIFELALRLRPDCFVLDYQFKNRCVLGLFRELQSDMVTRTIPIVVLTAHRRARLACLDSGADQFVAKGGPPEELLAAVRACVRRRSLDSGTVSKGDLKLDLGTLIVHWNGVPIATLSEEQFLLFDVLVAESPRTVSREELGRRLFPRRPAYGETKALDQLVSRMKKKLGPLLAGRVRDVKGFGWVYLPGGPAPRARLPADLPADA